jgi:hypothetical protein
MLLDEGHNPSDPQDIIHAGPSDLSAADAADPTVRAPQSKAAKDGNSPLMTCAICSEPLYSTEDTVTFGVPGAKAIGFHLPCLDAVRAELRARR